jgi:hypothetical protein
MLALVVVFAALGRDESPANPADKVRDEASKCAWSLCQFEIGQQGVIELLKTKARGAGPDNWPPPKSWSNRSRIDLVTAHG